MRNLFKKTIAVHHLINDQQNVLVTLDRDGTILSCIDITEDNLSDAWGLSIVVAMLFNHAAAVIGDDFKVIVPSELREATKIALRGNIHSITLK